MKAKKLLAAGICITMMGSLFAGCTGGKENDVGTMTDEEIQKFEADAGGLKLPLDKKGTEINFMTESSNTGMTDSVVIKELSRRTGAKITVTEIPLATIKEKAKVLVASKTDMPDVIAGGFTAEEVNDLGMQGAFEPILEHVDELPNFKNLFIDRAAELMTCGIEGVTFNWNADKTHAVYIGFDSQNITIKDLEEKYGMCLSGVTRRYDKRSSYFNYTEKNQEAQDLMNNKPGGGYLPENPEPTLTSEEKEIVTKNDPKLRKLGEEFASKYILSGETGDAAWKNFLNQMEANGASETLAAQNAAQARYDQQ